jgi:hypothetical protein
MTATQQAPGINRTDLQQHMVSRPDAVTKVILTAAAAVDRAPAAVGG